MYGHIHVVLKDLVVKLAGLEAWSRVLSEAGCEGAEDKILDSVPLGEQTTFGLVTAVCKVLELTWDKALYTFGRHFIQFALRSGNRAFLKSQGSTFPEFLDNINNVHTHLERGHPSAKFPFLVAEAGKDGAVNSMNLSYLSTRRRFKSFVVGVITEIGLRLYGVDVVFEEKTDPPEDEELRFAAASHRAACWRLTWRERPGGPEPLLDDAPGKAAAKVPFPALHSSLTEIMGMLRRGNQHRRTQCAKGATQKAQNPKLDENALFAGVGSNFSRSVSQEKWETVRQFKGSRDCSGTPRHGMDRLLLRTVPAREVAADWSDPTLPRVSAFWGSSVGRAEDYELSCDDHNIDVFVSHCWSPPPDWDDVMGADISYVEIKSTMVSVMAKDIAGEKGDFHEWGGVRMWVDKACIVQDIAELKALCICLIDKFINRSEHVCVIFTWSYLERLWCVYEWACILVEKDPSKVWMQNELLVTDRTMPLYLDSVRRFSLARTKCHVESDRALLTAKIEEHFVSEDGFETLVKAAAIALMARSMAFRAGRSHVMRGRFFVPWVALAEELGFHELAEALATCRALEWRSKNSPPGSLRRAWSNESGSLSDVSADVSVDMPAESAQGVTAMRYHALINSWFDLNVVPVLAKIRDAVSCNAHRDGAGLGDETFN